MAASEPLEKDEQATDGRHGFITNLVMNGLESAQRLSEQAVTQPWVMLEKMGVSGEKAEGFKQFNLKLVRGAYGLTKRMTRWILRVAPDRAETPGASTSEPAQPQAGKSQQGPAPES